MKIVKFGVDSKKNTGFVKFVTQESEDMYHLYNIISKGDLVEGSTVRNVVKEGLSGGSKSKDRIRMTIRIQVERVEFDAEQCALRINGRNVRENEHIKMGQYHTLELELGFPYTLEKPEWDQLHLERLRESADTSRKAELVCIVVDEGLCHICLVTSAMTLTKARIERHFPKKNHGNYASAKTKFFREIYESFQRHCDFNRIKVVVIGSPGFWNEELLSYMMEQSLKAHSAASSQGNEVSRGGKSQSSRENSAGQSLHRFRERIVLCRASSARKVAVEELLESPEMQKEMQDVRAVNDVRVLAAFHKALADDQYRACYGLAEVTYADSQFAVDTLLITDSLLHTVDFEQRKVLLALLGSVKERGGTVCVLSAMHSSGAQLSLYTGIAALLRFPLRTELLGAEAPEDDIPSQVTQSELPHPKSEAESVSLCDGLPPAPPTEYDVAACIAML